MQARQEAGTPEPMNRHDDAPQRPGYTLLLLTALATLAFMDRQILAVLIQPVKAEFGLSDLQIGLITGLGFALTFGVLGVPLARLADGSERRRLIAWSRGIGGALGATGAAATGFWSLLVSRAGGAVSDAGGAPASMAMLADLYPPQQRARVMSIFSTAGSVGALLAMVLGAWIAQRYGWRAALGVVGCSALVLAVVLRFTVREPLHRIAQAKQDARLPAAARQGAVRELWSDPIVRWLIIGAGCALIAGYSFGVWNAALLVRRHGLSLAEAGWISGAAALASALGSLWAGAQTDRLARLDPRWQIRVPLIGLAVALVCGVAYLLLPAGATLAAAALVPAFGFFIAWWASPAYAALSFIVPAQRRATANAMVMVVGAIVGNGLGPIFTGWLSDVLSFGQPGEGLRYALGCMIAMLVPSMYAFARAMPSYPAAYHARVAA